jgi:hypothetical protein
MKRVRLFLQHYAVARGYASPLQAAWIGWQFCRL